MPKIASSAYDMISGMRPKKQRGSFVFVTVKDQTIVDNHLSEALACFQETEGMSMILPLEVAAKAGFDTDHPMHQITLNVYSSLEGVGLTSAVSSALSEHGIPCNMVAAYHHDHVFVPSHLGQKAMSVLNELQSKTRPKPS